MKMILSMAAFVGCIAMGMMLFSLSANAKTKTLMLKGNVKGEKVPDGNARLARVSFPSGTLQNEVALKRIVPSAKKDLFHPLLTSRRGCFSYLMPHPCHPVAKSGSVGASTECPGASAGRDRSGFGVPLPIPPGVRPQTVEETSVAGPLGLPASHCSQETTPL
jgi:hypothetical protein